LAPPAANELQSKAGELRHPLLRPVAIDLQRGLTPDSAAILAVIANPSLRIIRDRHALASAQLLQAGLLPNPTLDFTLDPVTGGNTVGAVTGYNIGVNWEVTALISHETKMAAARAGQQSARLDVAWQEWQVAQAAKKSAQDLLFLRKILAVTAAVDKRLAADAALIRKSVDAHEKTLLDLAAAEAASQKAHADALAARRDVRQQELMLNQTLGLPPEPTVNLQETAALPSQLELPSQNDLVDGLEHQRLDLLALRHGYESQEQTLHVAILSQFPKIVLGFHQASDTTNIHTTGFGVAIDLPIFDRQQGTIAIEKSNRQKLFDEYVSRMFEARSAIAMSLSDIRSLNEQIAAAEAAIPFLEKLVAAYEQAQREHNVDVRSYYAAQNDLAQKRIDVLKLQQQLLDNRIALELASGRYFPGPAATAPASRPATAEAK
jgi:outer membrane protein TolC